MPIKVEVIDQGGRGKVTRQREILPGGSYPFAYYEPCGAFQLLEPKVAFFECEENDLGGIVYTLDAQDIVIRNRRIEVPASALVGKEPESFSLGGIYEIDVAIEEGASGLLVARHEGKWAEIGQDYYSGNQMN